MRKSFGNLIPRELLRYLGPGFLVTVGFIDPGNWAANIEAGSRFGYRLLWVITLATLMLIVLQSLAARLGIISGRSLAANIRERFPRPVSHVIGATMVLASIATSVAELLGAALGLLILFGIPIWAGTLMTVGFCVVAITGQKYHSIERLILAFLAIIAASFIVELFIVRPVWGEVVKGLVVPALDGTSIYIVLGMLGAVVMPHNIFLHSNVILSRDWEGDETVKRQKIRYEKIDTVMAMTAGFFVNASMIVVAGAVFFVSHTTVSTIADATATLRPLAGEFARTLFGVALLCSGLSSSITSSMSAASIVSGFYGLNTGSAERAFYRVGLIFIVAPAALIVMLVSDSYRLLIASQVALSFQLPFTIIPLIALGRDRRVMGNFFARGPEFIACIGIAAIVIALNCYLIFQTFRG